MLRTAANIVKTIPAKQWTCVVLFLCVIVLPLPFASRFFFAQYEYMKHDTPTLTVDPTGDDVVMGDAFENLMWVIHVTDIRTSVFPTH